MKNYYFIDWTFNWADEMEIYSCEVMTEKEYEDAKLFLENNKFDDEVSSYIGSNEESYWTWDDFYGSLKQAKKLTEAEYNAAKKMFGGTSFGEFTFEEVKELISEE